MWATMSAWFERAQGDLFEAVVQPLAFELGAGNVLEVAFDATGWFLIGLIQIAVLVGVIGPMQRWRPVEPLTDKAAVRVDVLYTLIHRLGVFPLAMFFTLDSVLDDGLGALRALGLPTMHVDQVWPGVTDLAAVSFCIYLVVFDAVNYLIHRAQHRWAWWWALHALHHSQRQMTMWSDNRNHLLDDVIRDVLLVVVAIVIGVAPGQFVLLVALGQLSESLQHANVRMTFGYWGERLWVSPRFHRLHHAVGIGHETVLAALAGSGNPARVVLGGHNFGVLLPWWDIWLGTANFEDRFDATGVRDQVEHGRDYGRGFWRQQWLGLLRLVGRA
jgi:sterol desaturase/sphingolipid hydroxylase (fatty acid hydroxylase superfamily)